MIDYRAIEEPTVLDLMTLKGCAQERDLNLRLDQDQTDDGVHYITVTPKGTSDPLWTVLRTAKTWIVHACQGPAHEFVTASEAATFLASGHAATAKRSWLRTPWGAVGPRPGPELTEDDRMGLRGPKRRPV